MKLRYRSKSLAGHSLPVLLAINRDRSVHPDQGNKARSNLGMCCTLTAFAVLALILSIALPATARAQLLGSLTEGPASAPYTYYLTVQFDNGHYYDYTLRSTTASYMGTDFINTVSAGSQGTPLVLNVTQTAYSFGNAVTGITINTDTDNGFTTTSYWNYWLGSATNPVNWTYSDTGEDTRTLTPGEADGWVFADSTTQPSATTFAVPEPSTWALAAVGLAGGGAWTFRRRGRRPAVS